MKISVSPSATETSIPLPTPTLVTLFPTPTPYSLPIVNFLQAIPPTLAPGILQGKIIFNRDYDSLFDQSDYEDDATTILYLNDYHEEYFDEITRFSYFGGAVLFPNATYSPTFENFVWSHNGQHLAFPVINRGVQLFILNSKYFESKKEIFEENLQRITISPTSWDDTTPNGSIRHISWSPNNQQVIIDMYSSKISGPCIVDIPTEEVMCGMLFGGFSQEENEIISATKAISWSPFDESKIAFVLQKDTETHKAGLYLLDLENTVLKLLWQIPVNTKYPWETPYPLSPSWYENGERIAFSPETNQIS